MCFTISCLTVGKDDLFLFLIKVAMYIANLGKISVIGNSLEISLACRVLGSDESVNCPLSRRCKLLILSFPIL